MARVRRAPAQLHGIRRLPNGTYRVRRKGHGDRRARTLTEARAIHADMYAVPAGATVLGDRRLSIATYAETWLRELTADGILAPSTVAAYRSAISTHVAPDAFGSLKVATVTAKECAAYFRQLRTRRSSVRPYGQLTDGTVRGVKTALSAMFSHAVRANMRAANPVVAGVRLPAATRGDIDPPTADQLRELRAAVAADPAMSALTALALATGARIGELLGLTWQLVELDGPTPHVKLWQQLMTKTRTLGPTKTGARRVRPLDEVTVAALRRHRAAQAEYAAGLGARWQPYPVPGGLVFTNATGGGVSYSTAAARLAEAAELSGLAAQRRAEGLSALHWHHFRHAHASIRVARGEDLYQVSRDLGHASIRMTADTYGHLRPESDPAGANARAGALGLE
jgi:integrase